MLNSPKHQEAERLAGLGIPVIRLEADGKRPSTAHGLKDRTTDLDTIEGWYRAGDWNIGICPADMGCFAIDYDGIDPLLGPRTRLHQTPSGGYHAFYVGDLPPSVKRLPNVDIRGRESYVLMPPSTVNGTPYTVVDNLDPVPAPDYLLRMFARPEAAILEHRDFEADSFEVLAASYAYMHAAQRSGDVPTSGNHNDHAVRFLLRLHGLGCSSTAASQLYQAFIAEHPHSNSVEHAARVAGIIERVWSGQTGDNPPGSELPPDPLSLLADHPGDDGAPRLLNGEDLDDAKVPLVWATLDASTMPEPASVPMLAGDWIEKGVFDYHEGGGGLGKSYIAQQDALCLQAGLPILGQPVDQTDVFYLNYEEPADEFNRRLYRIAHTFAMPDGTPVQTAGLQALHLRSTAGSHLLRVTKAGNIIITRLGRSLLKGFEGRARRSQHSYLILDGLMDAILFEGSTRSEDDVARQVIALLDTWCTEYNLTGRGIMHPSRAGERTGADSYAPAWTTKPRARQQYTRVTHGGKPAKVSDNLPARDVFTRRMVVKRSHGAAGIYVDLQYENGVFIKAGHGGQDPMGVAVAIAIKSAGSAEAIHQDGVVGTDYRKLAKGHPQHGTATTELNSGHWIIKEYRQRTGQGYGAAHLLGMLVEAEKQGLVIYRQGLGDVKAGYHAPLEPVG